MTTFRRRIAEFLSAFLVLHASLMLGETTVADDPTFADVVYGTVGEISLKLDFYEPTQRRPQRPLLIWVHGGAWRSGSKAGVPVVELRKHGFAIASVDYRLSPVAKFPAQIHDIKMAIRYLRTNAEQLGVDANRFVLAGASAGGHLAVLAAVTDNVHELNGLQPASPETSSSVQAAVSFYGAANLQSILSQSTPFGINMRVPALELLLGGVPEQQPMLARLASPVEHVDAQDPPLWLFHGDQDPQMPINQSHELVGAYKKSNLPVQFDVVYGAAHGGDAFYTAERLRRLGEELFIALANESPTSPGHQASNNSVQNPSEALEGKSAD